MNFIFGYLLDEHLYQSFKFIFRKSKYLMEGK